MRVFFRCTLRSTKNLKHGVEPTPRGVTTSIEALQCCACLLTDTSGSAVLVSENMKQEVPVGAE